MKNRAEWAIAASVYYGPLFDLGRGRTHDRSDPRGIIGLLQLSTDGERPTGPDVRRAPARREDTGAPALGQTGSKGVSRADARRGTLPEHQGTSDDGLVDVWRLFGRWFDTMQDELFDILEPASEARIEHATTLPSRDGRTADLPRDLHPFLQEALGIQGIKRLWTHQRACWDVVARGEHLIVTTGTASGKSMCFNLPVLDHLHRVPTARALYLYPTKALAQDQIRRLRPIAGVRIEPAVYDGDTPSEARRLARTRGRLLLTNPDMLSMAILPHHERWGDFLFNLTHVVIDEAHTYRGVFGSHVANVLRRLRRAAAFYGAEPRFILASATIGNAVQHAERLTGLPMTAVADDGAPAGRRRILLWNPPLTDEVLNLRRGNATEAAEILATLIRAGIRTICFTKSRRSAELVHQYTAEHLSGDKGGLASRLSPYRAGYTAEERREIERRLFEGELLAVVSTNALELGIDVGTLDAVITVGYPGTVASLWQQWGRAGRGKGESIALFVAGNDALEQFFIRNPEELLHRQVEAATIDFANPYIHDRHLAAAAYEAPLAEEDQEFFGPGLPAAAERAAGKGFLHRGFDAWVVTGEGYPAAEISLRSSSPDQFTIVDGETGAIVGTQEAETAFSFLHPGAVYLHRGDSYLVTELDIEGRVAAVRRFFDSYYTHPRKESSTEIVAEESREPFGPLTMHLGALAVSSTVIAFQKKRLGGDEVLGTEELDLPTQHFLTEGIWFTFPLELLPDERSLPRLPGALHAVEHSLIALLPLLAMCDRWDIGGLSTALHPQTELPTVFVYDGHPGGVGIARKGFETARQWFEDAERLISECGCEAGCPSCIQSPKCGNWNEPLDKELALELLRRVLRA
jgi:DEAD/DEAH box helicase domain-containing protein